ncbi:hypothetical protein SRB17_21850 [Streptomyces sp. RB17]|uniref:hypothetical protein n=1 Tax=Streptomyces sp. RB17 TaxID=2585197 RepID=UPI0012977447|nr:hypothetical protein [Streptomyces sp. RB17]MQY34219.1 hypothetical protein [Streptomyces sp. RB17]
MGLRLRQHRGGEQRLHQHGRHARHRDPPGGREDPDDSLLPPTGSAQGTVSVQAHLTEGAVNSLTFTGGPALGGITVHPIAGTGNGASLVLWSRNGGDNQKWSRT